MLTKLRAIYNTVLFNGGVLLFPISPGTLAWNLFGNKKGKLPLVGRDLICDTETLMSLPKSEGSLDEFTTAFSPFIPLLTLTEQPWKVRRNILASGLRNMQLTEDVDFALPLKKGDIYWDVFEGLFKIGFKLIFGRPATPNEYDNMYPGVADINSLIKRQASRPNKAVRWKLYHQVVALLKEDNPRFIFHDSHEFKALSEIDQVSIIVEDILTSICIQCTDLICHLLLLYPSYPDLFDTQLDNCIDETLRLYPLTDIWTRKSNGIERAWIASLMQLNRNGWDNPDSFIPDRWNTKDHPPLISWGFDARSCPATKIGYNLSKAILQKILANKNIWLQPASNYDHERTFTDGCQIWVGEGHKPASLKWTYNGKWKNRLRLWLNSRLRVLDQGELW